MKKLKLKNRKLETELKSYKEINKILVKREIKPDGNNPLQWDSFTFKCLKGCPTEYIIEAPYKNNRVKVYCGGCGTNWKCTSKNFSVL